MTLDQKVEGELAEAREFAADEKDIVLVKLAEARKYAEQGDASAMGYALKSAQKQAQIAGNDISSQVASIREVGYEIAVPVELANAEEYIRKKNTPAMESSLELAQRYAQRARLDVSAEVAQIRAGLQK